MTDAATVRAWFDAAADPEIEAALLAIYESVADEVRVRRPLCLASGHCCQFERTGHRLYVSGLEAALTFRERVAAGAPLTSEALQGAAAAGSCPFLVEGRRCGAHERRPLGCRVYFCDRTAETPNGGDWQETLYERLHRAILDLHEERQIPYRYGEWRAVLNDLLCDPGPRGY